MPRLAERALGEREHLGRLHGEDQSLASVLVPEAAVAAFAAARERGEEERRAWGERLERWRDAEPQAVAEWEAAWDGRPSGWDSRKSTNAWASGERVRSLCVTR